MLKLISLHVNERNGMRRMVTRSKQYRKQGLLHAIRVILVLGIITTTLDWPFSGANVVALARPLGPRLRRIRRGSVTKVSNRNMRNYIGANLESFVDPANQPPHPLRVDTELLGSLGLPNHSFL